MRRIIVLFAMSAILVLSLAVPAFAKPGGVKPSNYGDCMSHVATIGTVPGGLDLITPKEFAELSGPDTIRCQGQPPP
jgi:hypothetical protein